MHSGHFANLLLKSKIGISFKLKIKAEDGFRFGRRWISINTWSRLLNFFNAFFFIFETKWINKQLPSILWFNERTDFALSKFNSGYWKHQPLAFMILEKVPQKISHPKYFLTNLYSHHPILPATWLLTWFSLSGNQLRSILHQQTWGLGSVHISHNTNVTHSRPTQKSPV